MRAVLPLLAMGVWGVACATASADGSHGQVGLRLGIGAPIDNNMRDWKDVGVIHGISWFLNHRAGTSLMTAVDIDSRIPAKASSDGRATGISFWAGSVHHLNVKTPRPAPRPAPRAWPASALARH